MRVKTVFLTLVLAGAAVAPAVGQINYDVDPKKSTDGTAVPDVDKAGIQQGQPVPPGPAGDDYGCWAATAANLLGAGGWGVGANAQTKADNIYQDFINQFKVNAGDTYLKAGGDCSAAAKWWVHNIGLNSAKAGQGYTPTNTYVNFRLKKQTLHESDYTFLLDELVRCQYVGVFWITGGDLGHGMTLVGGNYGPHHPPVSPTQVSVWHNSDNEGIGTDDNVYGHDWDVGPDPAWYLNMNGVLGDHDGDWLGDGYWTECPGVPKPEGAIDIFDVHYYIGLLGLAGEDPDYYVTGPQMLSTGSKHGTYKGPDGATTDAYWESTGPPTLIVPNEVVEEQYKKLYVSVDFNVPVPPEDGEVGQAELPDIKVYDDNDIEIALDSWQWAKDPAGAGEQVLLTYVFDDQPDWEKVVFPGQEYVDLLGQVAYNVLEWNIATECVPEPATLGLLGVGLVMMLVRRKR